MAVKVVVHRLRGEQLEIELCDNEEQFKRVTVLQLNEKIAERLPELTGQVENIRLIFTHRFLDNDSDLLIEYGVQHLSDIHMVVKVPGGSFVPGKGDGGMGDKGGKKRSKEKLFSF